MLRSNAVIRGNSGQRSHQLRPESTSAASNDQVSSNLNRKYLQMRSLLHLTIATFFLFPQNINRPSSKRINEAADQGSAAPASKVSKVAQAKELLPNPVAHMPANGSQVGS